MTEDILVFLFEAITTSESRYTVTLFSDAFGGVSNSDGNFDFIVL